MILGIKKRGIISCSLRFMRSTFESSSQEVVGTSCSYRFVMDAGHTNKSLASGNKQPQRAPAARTGTLWQLPQS